MVVVMMMRRMVMMMRRNRRRRRRLEICVMYSSNYIQNIISLQPFTFTFSRSLMVSFMTFICHSCLFAIHIFSSIITNVQNMTAYTVTNGQNMRASLVANGQNILVPSLDPWHELGSPAKTCCKIYTYLNNHKSSFENYRREIDLDGHVFCQDCFCWGKLRFIVVKLL